MHAEQAEGDAAAELELAEVYEAYVALRDRSGRSDGGSIALAALQALAADPSRLGRAPRLPLRVRRPRRGPARAGAPALRLRAGDGRRQLLRPEALSARSQLYTRLRRGARRATVDAELQLDETYTERDSLRNLDRHLFEPSAEPVPADDGVRLLEAAGERGEAEAIGTEIATLLAAGADPTEIVVALRRPAQDGPLMASVLRSMGIPVALGDTSPVDRTAVGRALIELCEAAFPAEGSDPAVALLAHLRADPSFSPGLADSLERTMRREGTSEIDELIGSWSSPPRYLARVSRGRPGTGRAARPGALRSRPGAGGAPRARAARRPSSATVSRSTRSSSAPPGWPRRRSTSWRQPASSRAAPSPSWRTASRRSQAATVPAWRGTAEGRVRIVGPAAAYAAPGRATCSAPGCRRACSRRRGTDDPLLGEQARSRLGIPALRRRDHGDDERYLFHVCVTRPTERLYLSWRQSDDDGAALPRSPFVDEVLDLIGDGSERRRRR